jgi:REP-associated tyrosine transposase
MAHSYSKIFIHYVFSTKNREKIITDKLQERLWSYMGGIARENNMNALAIGGVEDHVHLLVSLPATLSIAKAIQLIKGGSSKWVHDTFPNYNNFKWQKGYGAFSVSSFKRKGLIDYINSQKNHHIRQSFREEYVSVLEKHVIDYDDHYIGG